MTNIGRFLKRERIYRNMTIKELAKKISKSSPYISMIENGKSNPSSDYLYIFSKAMFDKLKNEPAYLNVVAENYIKLCKRAGVKIKTFDKVDSVLKKMGLYEQGESKKHPYYLMNWLLMQNNEEVVFGVQESLEGERELRYLDVENIYIQNPKEFVFLDKKDKEFLLHVITNYIESKYGGQIIENDYADFVGKFDYKEREELDLSKHSDEEIQELGYSLWDSEDED